MFNSLRGTRRSQQTAVAPALSIPSVPDVIPVTTGPTGAPPSGRGLIHTASRITAAFTSSRSSAKDLCRFSRNSATWRRIERQGAADQIDATQFGALIAERLSSHYSREPATSQQLLKALGMARNCFDELENTSNVRLGECRYNAIKMILERALNTPGTDRRALIDGYKKAEHFKGKIAALEEVERAFPAFHNCTLEQTHRPGHASQFRFHDPNENNGLFSNFWSGQSIKIGEDEWPTVEHYFQAQKFAANGNDDTDTLESKRKIRDEIFTATTPDKAKKIAGNNRPGEGKRPAQDHLKVSWGTWNTKRIEVMYDAVFAKFSQDIVLKAALLNTDGAALVETMPPERHDNFWGVIVTDRGRDNARGFNMLGRVLAAVRDELKSADGFDRNTALQTLQNSRIEQEW